MKNIFILCIFFLTSLGCKNNENASKEEDAVRNDTVSKIVDGHTTRNSIDWQGTYRGILPCADCPGIETELRLNTNNTYVLKRHYLNAPEGQNEFISKGKFTWNEKGGSIVLKGIEEGSPHYFVGENYVLMLQRDGTKVKGELAENYKLLKE